MGDPVKLDVRWSQRIVHWPNLSSFSSFFCSQAESPPTPAAMLRERKPSGGKQNPSEIQICSLRRFYLSLDIRLFAEAFCIHKFIETYPDMAGEIKWNIVGREELIDNENQISSVASCDVFQFSDGRLVEITSSVIELNKPE